MFLSKQSPTTGPKSPKPINAPYRNVVFVIINGGGGAVVRSVVYPRTTRPGIPLRRRRKLKYLSSLKDFAISKIYNSNFLGTKINFIIRWGEECGAATNDEVDGGGKRKRFQDVCVVAAAPGQQWIPCCVGRISFIIIHKHIRHGSFVFASWRKEFFSSSRKGIFLDPTSSGWWPSVKQTLPLCSKGVYEHKYSLTPLAGMEQDQPRKEIKHTKKIHSAHKKERVVFFAIVILDRYVVCGKKSPGKVHLLAVGTD